jgi:hypothetical protein
MKITPLHEPWMRGKAFNRTLQDCQGKAITAQFVKLEQSDILVIAGWFQTWHREWDLSTSVEA